MARVGLLCALATALFACAPSGAEPVEPAGGQSLGVETSGWFWGQPSSSSGVSFVWPRAECQEVLGSVPDLHVVPITHAAPWIVSLDGSGPGPFDPPSQTSLNLVERAVLIGVEEMRQVFRLRLTDRVPVDTDELRLEAVAPGVSTGRSGGTRFALRVVENGPRVVMGAGHESWGDFGRPQPSADPHHASLLALSTYGGSPDGDVHVTGYALDSTGVTARIEMLRRAGSDRVLQLVSERCGPPGAYPMTGAVEEVPADPLLSELLRQSER